MFHELFTTSLKTPQVLQCAPPLLGQRFQLASRLGVGDDDGFAVQVGNWVFLGVRDAEDLPPRQSHSVVRIKRWQALTGARLPFPNGPFRTTGCHPIFKFMRSPQLSATDLDGGRDPPCTVPGPPRSQGSTASRGSLRRGEQQFVLGRLRDG
jgi:hypothetical protein